MGSNVLVVSIRVGLVDVRYWRCLIIIVPIILGASCSIRFWLWGLVVRVASQVLFSQWLTECCGNRDVKLLTFTDPYQVRHLVWCQGSYRRPVNNHPLFLEEFPRHGGCNVQRRAKISTQDHLVFWVGHHGVPEHQPLLP